MEVSAERVGSEHRVTVRDDGRAVTIADGGMGIGLANLRERLRLAYGDRARLAAGPAATGFEATVTIPLR